MVKKAVAGSSLLGRENCTRAEGVQGYLVDLAREAFLILDANLRVISANEVFYQHFRVTPKQTENKHVDELGNGQWNIPELKRLLEEILLEKKVEKIILLIVYLKQSRKNHVAQRQTDRFGTIHYPRHRRYYYQEGA